VTSDGIRDRGPDREGGPGGHVHGHWRDKGVLDDEPVRVIHAEVVKTPAQQAIWGGTAGEQFDPCYHEACDTLDNADLHALEVNSDSSRSRS
jgi:hypothetical protein